MAGIGFRLRKIFEYDTYIDNIRGIIYSSSVAGGPIFFSILCLSLLGVFSSAFISSHEMKTFLVTIVYVYAFALISTSVTQLLITRYLSDLIYANELHRILPTFTSVLIITALCQLIIGFPIVFFLELDIIYRLTALMLFITVGCIWQLMVFSSALKNYKIILFAFMFSLVMSFLLAIVLGKKFGLTGFLHGYTIGHIALLFILLSRIFIEFESSANPELNFAHYFKKVPHLVFIGIFYNSGIWVDKMIFWFSSQGEQINSFLFSYAHYDGATFFAYLTVIPAYAYFLVQVETEFYGFFRAYFQTILKKEPLKIVIQQKQRMATSLTESFLGLIKIQGTTTLLCLFYSDEIISALKIPVLGALILEKALIATFLQMLLLTLIIFMMYFDLKNQLVKVTAVFLTSNTILTYLTLKLGYVYYGYGYLVACLISFLLGYFLLNKHFRELEYHTFVSQPLKD